jgi:hypothetical protein
VAERVNDLSGLPCDPWGGVERTYLLNSEDAPSDGIWLILPTWVRRVQLRTCLFATNDDFDLVAPSVAAVEGFLSALSRSLGGTSDLSPIAVGASVGAGISVNWTYFLRAVDPPLDFVLHADKGSTLRWRALTFVAPPAEHTWEFCLSLTLLPEASRSRGDAS